jgi:hypothetical protein
MADSWCFAHSRFEESTDYIDFECSPLFLGALHEMGQTQRRPISSAYVENTGINRELVSENIAYPRELSESFSPEISELYGQINALRSEIRELKSRRNAGSGVVQQREIDVS